MEQSLKFWPAGTEIAKQFHIVFLECVSLAQRWWNLFSNSRMFPLRFKHTPLLSPSPSFQIHHLLSSTLTTKSSTYTLQLPPPNLFNSHSLSLLLHNPLSYLNLWPTSLSLDRTTTFSLHPLSLFNWLFFAYFCLVCERGILSFSLLPLIL